MMRLPLLPCVAALAGLLLVLALVSVSSGAMNLAWQDTLSSLWQQLTGRNISSLAAHEAAVIRELRVPRTLLAIIVGLMLAQSGAVMQGLFRNPLADPGIVGVSSGAAVGAVLAIFLSDPAQTWLSVPLAAFAGGLVASLVIYRLAQSPFGTSVLILLLAGIAVSALAMSIIGLVSYLADDTRLRDLTMWQLGSLAGASPARVWFALPVAILIAWRYQARADALNALLLGEAEARHLGINVESLKQELILLVALGVGIAVAFAGLIGFVGLVVPHLVRSLIGPNHHSLLPLAGLLGGSLLLMADIVARLAIAPAELPVGLLTALLGAPFFIILLLQVKHQ